MISQQHQAGKSKRRLSFFIEFALLITGFTSSLITILSLLTPLLKATFLNVLVPLQDILIPISFFILGACTTIVSVQVCNRIYSRYYPVRWFLYGYRWTSARYQYSIADDTKTQHSQIAEITIRAIRIGVSIFENKYLWSGHGKQESIEVLSTGHELMSSSIRQQNYFPYDRWRYYYVYLGHEIPVDEDVVIKIKQELSDDMGTFESYLSKTITERLERLELSVLIPDKLQFYDAYNYELGKGPRFERIHRVACPRKHIQVNGNWYIELFYVIPEPHIDHKYQIRWEW